MAIERVSSVFEVPALKDEFDFFLNGMKSSNAAVIDLYANIKSYKDATFKTMAAETEKLATTYEKTSVASEKMAESQRRAEEAMKRATMESIQSRQNNVNLAKSYGDMSGSIEQNIKLQLRYKAELEALRAQQKELSKAFGGSKESAEGLRKKQIEVAQSIEELKNASGELGRTIRLQVKEQQAAGGSLDEMKAKYDRLFQVFRGLNDSDRQSGIGEQLNKDLEELSANINEIQKSAGNFSGNVGRYMGSLGPAFQVLSDELTKIRSTLSTMDQGSAGFDELVKQEKMLTTLTDGLNKEFSSTTMEIRALQKAAVTLGIEFGNDTEVFQKFKNEVGSSVDSMQDIQAQVKLAASDTRALDGMIGAAEGLAGAYSVAEGASALFGGSSEELMKTMVKLQAVMSILQGLQTIRNALQAESAAMDFIATVRTKALAAAQTLYAFATGGATIATKALRVALIATGIGAIVVLLLSAADAMGAFGDSTEDTTKSLEDQKAAADDLVESIRKVSEATAAERATRKGGINDLRREIELAKASGASKEKIHEMELALMGKEKDELKILGQTYVDAYNRKKKNGELTVADTEAFNAEVDRINKDGLDKANAIEAAKASFSLEKNKERNAAALEKNKELLEAMKRDREARFDVQQMEFKDISENLKRITDAEDAGFSVRLSALAKWQETEQELIIRERDFQLKTAKGDEVLKIRKDAEIKLAKVVQEGFDIRKGLLATNAEKEKQDIETQLNELLGAAENAANNASGKATSLSDLIFGQNDAEYTEKLSGLAGQLDQRNITIEQYQKEKEKLDIEYAGKELTRQINLARQVLEIRKYWGQDVSEQIKKINELERQQAERTVKVVSDTEAAKAQKRKEHLEGTIADMEKVAQVLNAAMTIGTDLASIGIDRQKVKLEELNAAQEKAYEDEVRRITASGATEEEKANRLKILEAERMAQKEANERRQRKLDVERARFQKISDITGIITSTSLAVAKALAMGGPWAIPQAVIIGALGAAQLARAIATPLPKYEHGTDSAKGGWAITDEKGAEMYVEPGGNTFLGSNQGPVMRYLKPGTKVIPADEVNQQLNQSMMAATARQLMLAASYQREKESNTALNRIEEAILQGTDATLREMRNNKKGMTIYNQIDTSFGLYLKEKTFN